MDCCICGKSISVWSGIYADEEVQGNLCEECSIELSEIRKARDYKKFVECKNRICEKILQQPSDAVKTEINLMIRKYEEDIRENADIYEKEQQERVARENRYTNMIVTTTHTLQGYVIKEYKGMVFGETILKASFKDSVSASIENFGSTLDFFSQTEMSGSMELLLKAREFAIEKIKNSAAEKGANAVVGIDMESTVGVNSVLHVTIYGTAVVIEREERIII